MFIELIDHLRCPVAHAETWLVAAVEQMEGRYVARGSLGCPICHARYDVRDFVVHFAMALPSSVPYSEPTTPADDAVVRLAALLDLRAAGGFVGLSKAWASFAAPLASTFDVQCVVLDATGRGAPGAGVSIIVPSPDGAPFAAGSLRALALDDTTGTSAALVRSVRHGGRVVAPTTVAVPDGVHEVARDAAQWVSERTVGVSLPIPLGRRR